MASPFFFRRTVHIFFLSHKSPQISHINPRHFSNTTINKSLKSPHPDPKISLSSRLSFVFDQIDALERKREISAKDEALNRILTWRESNQPSPKPSNEIGDVEMIEESKMEEIGMKEFFRREIEVVHPWPEWIELMERIAIQNYFDCRRGEEDRVAGNVGIDISGVREEVGFDLTRDWTAVRTAFVNFGRDRFDILKSLSRKDIQVMVGHGCPSMDSKVVFSAKLLRKYVHIDEGDVCSSCSLRNSCSRGYILVPKEDEARTLDVMRILLTFGFDHIKESIENVPLRKMKSVKSAVRKLLHEVVKLSAIPRDPNLLPPVIKKPPPKVKQPPPQPKRRVGRDDVEMKKGDWLCSKCDFMNFAKNIVCLQCDAKRPKRQLLPGEWECPKCNFLNYRRNMSCFECEHDRPPDEFTENQNMGRRIGPNTRLQRPTRTPDISNAWNLDFEDNESDGADVAAFEFADSSKARDGSSFNEQPHGVKTREFEDNIAEHQDGGRYFSNHSKGGSSSHSHATGFDDFDDEEDDNVDSYELDEADGKDAHRISRKSLSEFESGSESEDFDEHNRNFKPYQNRKDYSSEFEDDDAVISAESIDDNPNSFNSGDSMHEKNDLKQRRKIQFGRRDSNYNDRQLASDFDDDDDDDDDLYFNKSNKKGHEKNDLKQRRKIQFGRRDSNYNDRQLASDFDDDDDDNDDLYFNRSNKKGLKVDSEKKGHKFQDSFHFGSENDRRNSFGNDDLYSGRKRNQESRVESKNSGRRFHESSRIDSQRIGRNSFGQHDYDKFDNRKGSNLKRRGDIKKSSYGARDFQKSGFNSKGNGYGRRNEDHEYQHSFRRSDQSKFNNRQFRKNGHNQGQFRDFNDDYDSNDNNRRRRIIER